MNLNPIRIAVALSALFAPSLAVTGWAATSVSGAAELAYIKFDAEADGKELYSGQTLAQKYSLAYKATNLRTKGQTRYYNLMLGYDWMSFDTNVTSPESELTIKQSFGRVKYSGDVGFTSDELPIEVRAYANDDQYAQFRYNLNSIGLINDGLVYNIEGRGSSVSSGLSLTFEPRNAKNITLRGLPRMLLDYRQTVNKSTESFIRTDNRTRELAVAGLNTDKNWVNYRQLSYEDFIDPSSNYTRQQIQIGMVDRAGRRLWSQLTNWIEVSVDGQLTNVRGSKSDKMLEEYDVNFMLTASRKLWSARSFMNYNRQLDEVLLTETARVPVYIKGVYGRETDWHLSLAATRARQKALNQSIINNSATNSIFVGGTTFNRSNFTVSPSVSLQTTKDYNGVDSYTFDSSLETASTRRFSEKLGLAGKVTFRTTDDGFDTGKSKTWSSLVDLKINYSPNSRFSYNLQERLEAGSGSGFIEPGRLLYGTAASTKVGTYVRNYLFASASWVPSSFFSTSLAGSYDIVTVSDQRPSDVTTIYYHAGFNSQDITSRFNTKYLRSQNGYDPARFSWINDAELQYRPDRYHDGLFRLSYQRDFYENIDTARLTVLQRYSYNLFSRVGLLRNLATLTEEYTYTSNDSYGVKASAQSLMFSGRYNPTERLSLYGSVTYATGSPGSVVMYYGAGMNADFKLLSTSLDYAYARRDSDKRQEKKLSAFVRRSF